VKGGERRDNPGKGSGTAAIHIVRANVFKVRRACRKVKVMAGMLADAEGRIFFNNVVN
jgi:hypothetical protein